jgi:hypothetical protein
MFRLLPLLLMKRAMGLVGSAPPGPVAGPYRVVAAQAFIPGAAAGQTFTPGAAAADIYVAGVVAGKAQTY